MADICRNWRLKVNNKNELLKYILSIWQISSEIGDLRLNK
jgi:hypothetical protein